ncbi:hypothetical protein ACHQM5_019758 [Ranunculus cassubicifolius]
MSLDVVPERVCYVHCNFCNTILAVSVPCTSLLNMVTVGCGHCANLLPVNMKALVQPNPLQDLQNHQNHSSSGASSKDSGSSSKGSSNKSATSVLSSFENREPPRMLPIRPAPEKRQRVPSAYNRFIKDEIQRIKASNPDITHREAFSTAAKNWAHFPHIHFGLMMEGNKRLKVSDALASEGTQKSQSFY